MNTARASRLLKAAQPSPIGSAEERMADDALFAMQQLRENLVLANMNLPACKVDDAMEALQAACRMVWPRVGGIAA